MIIERDVYAVGFDLDGTLYRDTPEIQNRVRTEIAKHLLIKNPNLVTISNARLYFEDRYKILQSGTKVLAEAGYEEASKIMDDCLARADIIDLLKVDEKLAQIMNSIKTVFFTYLITGSPRDIASKKLARIGLNYTLFNRTVFSDTLNAGSKSDGTAFQNILSSISIPPSHHVYIGDRINSDILPAKKLGMKTISVWSNIPEADLSLKHIHELEMVLL